MKIIRNNIIPFKGFSAINLFGVIFMRQDAVISDSLIRHEKIHTLQMRELLFIGFYLLYFYFWVRLLFSNNFDSRKAYSKIPFEIEAYANQHNSNYIFIRPSFAWKSYCSL